MTIDELIALLPQNLQNHPRLRLGGDVALNLPPIRNYLRDNNIDSASITFPPPPVKVVPAADALDLAAATAANSLVADVRDLAVLLQSAADAFRGQ